MATEHRILLVDDHADFVDALGYLLESWGCESTTATNPTAALAAVAERAPDAIMLDLGLPTLHQGIALIRDIRRLPGADRIVIMAITGHGRDVDRSAAASAGCDFFFLKPPDLDQVYDALRTLDTHHRRVSRVR